VTIANGELSAENEEKTSEKCELQENHAAVAATGRVEIDTEGQVSLYEDVLCHYHQHIMVPQYTLR